MKRYQIHRVEKMMERFVMSFEVARATFAKNSDIGTCYHWAHFNKEGEERTELIPWNFRTNFISECQGHKIYTSWEEVFAGYEYTEFYPAPIIGVEWNNWQPIETAPRDKTKILAWDGECMHVVTRNTSASGNDWPYFILKDDCNLAIESCYDGDCSYAEMNPTHWMPLPEPPK